MNTQIISQVNSVEDSGNVPFVDQTSSITTGNEIIAFSTVEAPTLETIPIPRDISNNSLSLLEEGRDHSLKDILTREYVFDDFIIVSGGTAGAILKTWSPLNSFLSQPNVIDKISGFAFFRCNLIVRLEFTTLPTITGGIMLSFYPDITQDALSGRTETRLQLSQVPNIQQSLTTAVSMKMKIPWISPFYGRDLVNGFGNLGWLILSRLTPSTTDSVAVRAYVSAEPDSIHLQYPTFGELQTTIAQKKQVIQRTLMNLRDAGLSKKELLDLLPTTEGKGRATEAAELSCNGVISGVLNAGSKIATVASGIPVIGSVAAAAAPLLGIGATIAGLFGYSKPIDDKPIRAFKWKPGDAQLTNEGVLPSHQFTINQACSVTADNFPFGSEVDEMAIEAIMKSPNIIGSFDITTANPARFVLYQRHLNLAQFQVVNTSDIIPSHQMWISSLFNQWNASLNFDFDVYLTHFHRVKLRFIVLPNVYLSNQVGTILNANFDINKASSAVVEFSGDNTNWSLRVDPRSNTTMKNTPSAYNAASIAPSLTILNSNLNTVQTSYGTLLVIIEVPLKASSNVSSTIPCVINFSADNVELTNPVVTLPLLPTTQGSLNTLGTAYAKMSRSERMVRGSDHLQSNSVGINNRKNIELCAGDACIHLRNILNAFSAFYPTVEFSGPLGPTTNSVITIRPSVRRATTDPGNSYPLSPGISGFKIDLIDYLIKGYAFFKGSVNLRIAIQSTSQTVVGTLGMTNANTPNYQVNAIPEADGVSIGGNITTYLMGSRVIPIHANEAVVDLNVPYYQTYHISRSNFNSILPTYGENQSNYIVYAARTGMSQQVDIFRSAGDDFRMGFLMSLPVFRFPQARAFNFPTSV